MPDADLIPLHELSWSAWITRRHGLYALDERSIVHVARYVLPRARCRLWALRNGYQVRGRTIQRRDAGGALDYSWIAEDLARRERARASRSRP
jgi:hypothetical protein